MEHSELSNLFLAALGAEIFRFVIRTTDLKDHIFEYYEIWFWYLIFSRI